MSFYCLYRLVSAVLRLCEVERRAIAARLVPHLSPQIGSTTMWFLRRWVNAYLFTNENYYSQVSVCVGWLNAL